MSEFHPVNEMMDLLEEIERVLPTVTDWKAGNIDHREARTFEGFTPDGAWHLVALDFDIEDQGFPPGSRGYDGVGRKGSLVIHFTRQLAEKVFQAALTRYTEAGH